jgi:hypothetical protein
MMTSRPGRNAALFPVLILALLVLVVFMDSRRRSAENRLNEMSVQLGQVGDQENREKAKAIVDEVRLHIDIPTDSEPTVATIVDVKKLQAQNPFYAKAQNGDYLIVTPTRAILYSTTEEKIIDVVPVQLEAATASSQRSSARAAAASSR